MTFVLITETGAAVEIPADVEAQGVAAVAAFVAAATDTPAPDVED